MFVRGLLHKRGRVDAIARAAHRHADKAIGQEIADYISGATACGPIVGQVQVATSDLTLTAAFTSGKEASNTVWDGRGCRVQVYVCVGCLNAKD